ncbi:MAG TPA: hypothetical protein HPP83_05625 [Candidatus Hydrogenedentes bacterium]|nr:hypothetical protein [Candidatus Hydrogenedentota bacterium]
MSAHLDEAKAVYEILPGWRCDISVVRCFGDLPAEAQGYVLRIEQLLGLRVGWVSVGPHREAAFRRNGVPSGPCIAAAQ